MAHVHALVHLRNWLVLLAVVLLGSCHGELQIFVDLDIGSEDKTAFAAIYPRSFRFVL